MRIHPGMKRILVVALLLIATVSLVYTQTKTGHRDAKVERELIELVRKWDAAIVNKDSAALESILATEFTLSGLSRAKYLASFKSANASVESAVSGGFDVRVYKDSAVLFAVDTIKSRRDGVLVTDLYGYTDFWVKRDGRWRCVATESSKLSPTPLVTKGESAFGTDGTLALTNVTVIDGNGGAPVPGMTLIISNGRIADMFASGEKKLPARAEVINLAGKYVIPGLIDSHYHLMLGLRSPEVEEGFRRFALLGGVTAVRDMAGDAVALAELAKTASDEAVQSPRVYFSAVMGGTAWKSDRRISQVSRGRPRGEAPWAREITPQTDIVQAVAGAKAAGVTGIKIYSDLTADLVAKITAEAHKQGLKVWSHAAVYPARPGDAVAAGVDVISHSNLVVSEGMSKVPENYGDSYLQLDYSEVPIESQSVSRFLQLMLDKGTILDPSMLVTSRLGKTDSGKIFHDPKGMEEWSYNFTLRAHIRKIPMVAGTDAQESPRTQDYPNLHTEMELLVEKVGLTPLEAITAATRNGARALGIADSYGTITKGKVADLVVLSEDPSADIKNSTKILFVIKGGIAHKWKKVVLAAN